MSYWRTPAPSPSGGGYYGRPTYNYPSSNNWGPSPVSSGNSPSTSCPLGWISSSNYYYACSPCPADTYSDTPGATVCKTCPSPLKSGLVGSTSVDNCINAAGNSIFGIVGIVFATYALLAYILNGRFHRISFYRRYLLQRLVAYLRVMVTKLDSYAVKARQAYKQKLAIEAENTPISLLGRRLRAVKFLVLATLLLGVGTLGFYLATMGKIFFDAMIIYKGFMTRFSVPVSDKLKGAAHDLGSALGSGWITDVFYPISAVIDFIGRLYVDFTGIKVVCMGSQLPMLLFFNVAIVGIVIIIIESEYVTFESVSLRQFLQSYLKTSTIDHQQFRRDFEMSSTKYWATAVFAGGGYVLVSNHLMGYALKTAMSLTEFRELLSFSFTHSPRHATCDSLGGAYFLMDSVQGSIAAALIVICIPTFLYTTTKFLVPLSIYEEGMSKTEMLKSERFFSRLRATYFHFNSEKTENSKVMKGRSFKSHSEMDESRKHKELLPYLDTAGSAIAPDLGLLFLISKLMNVVFLMLKAHESNEGKGEAEREGKKDVEEEEEEEEEGEEDLFAGKCEAEVPVRDILDVASGFSTDPRVIAQWERHYELRLPFFWTYLSRAVVREQLMRALANKNLKADWAAGAVHPVTQRQVARKHGCCLTCIGFCCSDCCYRPLQRWCGDTQTVAFASQLGNMLHNLKDSDAGLVISSSSSSSSVAAAAAAVEGAESIRPSFIAPDQSASTTTAHAASKLEQHQQQQQEQKQPLVNLLQTDEHEWVRWSDESSPAAPAWLEFDMGTPRIVHSYGLCSAVCDIQEGGGGGGQDPMEWRVLGKLVRDVELADYDNQICHPLDRKRDVITEEPDWTVLHHFRTGEDGHFVHITHEVNANTVTGWLARLGLAQSTYSLVPQGYKEQRRMVFPTNRAWHWELFALRSPVTLLKLRIEFLTNKAEFLRAAILSQLNREAAAMGGATPQENEKKVPLAAPGFAIGHAHVYVDKSVTFLMLAGRHLYRLVRLILLSYLVFISVCFGYWSERWAVAFELHPPVTHPERETLLEAFDATFDKHAAKSGSKRVSATEYGKAGAFLSDKWNKFASSVMSKKKRLDEGGVEGVSAKKDVESGASTKNTSDVSDVSDVNLRDSIPNPIDAAPSSKPPRRVSENMGAVLLSTLGSRAVLFQIIPGLSWLTVLASNVSAAPLFVFDKQLDTQLDSFFFTHQQALDEIFEDEPNLPRWRAWLRVGNLVLWRSRLLQAALGLLKFALSICTVYVPNPVGAFVTTALIWIPIGFIETLAFVGALADFVGVQNEDFAALWGACSFASGGDGSSAGSPETNGVELGATTSTSENPPAGGGGEGGGGEDGAVGNPIVYKRSSAFTGNNPLPKPASRLAPAALEETATEHK